MEIQGGIGIGWENGWWNTCLRACDCTSSVFGSFLVWYLSLLF